jgi:hypothetical protein
LHFPHPSTSLDPLLYGALLTSSPHADASPIIDLLDLLSLQDKEGHFQIRHGRDMQQ